MFKINVQRPMLALEITMLIDAFVVDVNFVLKINVRALGVALVD